MFVSYSSDFFVPGSILFLLKLSLPAAEDSSQDNGAFLQYRTGARPSAMHRTRDCSRYSLPVVLNIQGVDAN